MNRCSVLTCCLAVPVLPGCVIPLESEPLQTVEFVDVDRYLGTWYEIARYPNFFERGCAGVTAEYSLRDDGRIRVVNRCREGSVDGPERVIEGRARIVEPETNAKLKVAFFGPFEGDYWIIELDDAYQWAVVGEPGRRFLWILSRTPTLDEATYEDLMMRVAMQGYDPSRLVLTEQPPEE
jgi:apolipoprotein D and lipocalin family protein